MSVVPIQFSRVSSQTGGLLLSNELSTQQLNLLQVQQQISSGDRLSQISDDPGAAIGIKQLNAQIDGNNQSTSNLNFANSFLSTADNALGSLNDLISQATSVAQTQVGVTSSASQRQAQAQVIDSLLSQVLNVANTQYQNQSIFGGANGSQPAYASVAGGYKFQGSLQQQGVLDSNGNTIPYTVDGTQIFGGQSAELAGYQNLSPAVTAGTALADVNGAAGSGVHPGKIVITDGTNAITVDLSNAATMGDVQQGIQNALTAAGSSVTVALSGNHLSFTAAMGNALTVANGSGSTAASDLGITGSAAAGGTLDGTSVNPLVTATTPLSALNDGAGIDPSGFIITNGTTSSTITLAGVTTVQDLINKINTSGTNVQASINNSGTGINIINPVSGSPLSIGENGGHTADQLGIRTFNPSTQLSNFNGGTGITPVGQTLSGPSGNIVITNTTGTSFNVNVGGVTTAGELVTAINNAPGHGTVTAALNATGNGITISDSAGGAGNVSVAAGSDYTSNGTDLGIFSTGTGGTLTGSDMTFSTDDMRITRRDGTSFTVNMNGANTVQDVLNRINQADGNTNPAVQVVASLNATGNGITLSDPTSGAGTLTVSPVNASTVAAQLGLNTPANSSTPGVITGTDANPVEPQGIFSSLTMLRNALLNNDTAGITRAGQLLAANSQQAITARGVVGAREQDLQNRLTQNSNELTQLTQSLSLLSDTNMNQAITQFQELQTAYQATLQASQTTQNMSLLDFLK